MPLHATQQKTDAISLLRDSLETKAFIQSPQETIINHNGTIKTEGWLFDIRRIILDASIMEAVGSVFWDTFRSQYPLQIGGLESGAIPLVAGLVAHGMYAEGLHDISGFFIRKSRKKIGLTRMIEGEVKQNVPIILVDDLVNSGKSMIRQVEVLEELGHHVTAIWTLLRYRDADYYSYFKERNIEVISLFELNDFSVTLGIKNLASVEKKQNFRPINVIWSFASSHPSYHFVLPKSDPAIDNERIYMGSDSGIFWALKQSDGAVAWSKKIGFHPKGKGIFSSPLVHDGVVYFGAYDGNLYALETATGKRKWLYTEADWIGSSPDLAPELNMLFVGLEFGLWKKRGGIAAINIKNGKLLWRYGMPCYTHSSPRYIPKHREVVIGSNDGAAYLFDARDGSLKWKFSSGELTEAELDTGFSARDIKESFAYDAKRDLIIFGNMAGTLFLLHRKDGTEFGRFKAEFGFFSTPLVYKDSVLASSLDKHLYCIDLNTLKERWRWNAGARIFASPTIIGESIYIGANTGRLTELDPDTGKERSFMAFTERITNRPVYNFETCRLFVPTFANQLYCIDLRDMFS